LTGFRFVDIGGTGRKLLPNCSQDHRTRRKKKGKVTDTEPRPSVDCDVSLTQGRVAKAIYEIHRTCHGGSGDAD